MIFQNENNLLFDDASTIKNILGEGSLNATAVNADCDCINYTSTSDDENVDIANLLFDDMTRLEKILGKGSLRVTVNTDCDCIDYTQTFDDDGDIDTPKIC